MIKQVFESLCNYFVSAVLVLLVSGFLALPVMGQSSEASSADFESLRSDVGIHGLTANFHFMSDLSYLGDDNVQLDGSSELELVYRNVRMMSERLGVGYQLLTSFFANGGFGVGGWGAGPVIRAYPLRSDQFQPYVQINSLFGRNFGLSELANSRELTDGFRVRLGLRAGFALRLNNALGIFGEVGYDWESPRIFKAEARALQANIGIDYYLFN